MKKWLVSLAIGSLVLVGTLVVYKEALALPPFCDDCAAYCDSCNGNYIVDSCWYYNGLQYCFVRCENCKPGCNCGSTICVM